jgi:nucleoside-diphosphate-sugar epimerase
MRVLVTGHQGYIGSVLVPTLLRAGHVVAGLDAGLFASCTFDEAGLALVPEREQDVRDTRLLDLAGFDAVVHLANLSNDPLGDLDEGLTTDVNHRATVRLAELAREAGMSRFVFASSCSLYGSAGNGSVNEDAPMRPLTAYGRAKVLAERDLSVLASDDFSPVYLRNATVYGPSPRVRFDVVVNNLTAWAAATGRVRLNSNGLAWRPLVHVDDVCTAIVAALEAPKEAVHDTALNVGREAENYLVREVADLVAAALHGCTPEYAAGADADARSYRVSFERIAERLPDWRPAWTVPDGIAQLAAALEAHPLAPSDFEGPAFNRIAHLRHAMAAGLVGPDLRPTTARV